MKVALRVIGALILLWPVIPPLLHAIGAHSLATAIEWPWSLTCHRLPERTVSIFGSKMPMCSRCMGLDTGFGAGLIVGAPYRGPKWLWVSVGVATVLMLIEIQTQESGLHPLWHVTRAITGALLAYPVGAAISAISNRPKMQV